MIIPYLLVFILAAIPLFEVFTVVPIAIIGGLPAIPVAIVGFLGNLLTIFLLVVFVDNVKGWLRRRKKVKVQEGTNEPVSDEPSTIQVDEQSEDKKQKRARNLFDKYGLPGLTILGPLLVGSHIAAFMGMSFGTSRKLVTIWMIVSLVIWTSVSAIAASYGVTFFAPSLEEEGFLIKLFQ
ncbi:small multi-drug export protein [Metabacillus malikii]|uniref:Membrane protein n=1 Tax=Metabacillus malikii TaxID=1504265 RepID=A0ABT9ZFK0_9BACI|nr:small multi-drug export protein [Metabacillus malikii]MDQ0230030.1 putative membrane protein [Metabacillus malikii]